MTIRFGLDVAQLRIPWDELDDLDKARKHAGGWREAGYGYLVCGWPEAGDAQLEAFVRDVMPDFTA